LMTSVWARDLLRAAANYVDQKPSKAAIYRALDHVGLALLWQIESSERILTDRRLRDLESRRRGGLGRGS
jgi:hypothetical protein